MRINRNIRISVKDHIEAAFRDEGFNVYSESNLPSRDGSFVPVRPYVYIVDTNIEPTTLELPLVIVEINPISAYVAELGAISRRAEVRVHVYGSNRGERDDLASIVQEYLSTAGKGNTLSIYDYGQTATPKIGDGVVEMPVDVYYIANIPEWRRVEASTSNLNIVEFTVLLRV